MPASDAGLAGLDWRRAILEGWTAARLLRRGDGGGKSALGGQFAAPNWTNATSGLEAAGQPERQDLFGIALVQGRAFTMACIDVEVAQGAVFLGGELVFGQRFVGVTKQLTAERGIGDGGL